MKNLEKIAIAMSGGVDSSVAASIIKEKGYHAVGISLQLWNYSESDNRFGTCCSLDDLADARRVAEKIGIPYYILNMEKKFKEEVVDYFISEYMQARTPIPCTLCNQKLKFEEMIQKAESFGVKRVATGHYASIVKHSSGKFLVRRGRDRWKDQSYFLFNLSQAQLSRLEFPLGDMDKNEVRDRARQLGLNVAEKAESHEICFIPDNDYPKFIAKQLDDYAFQQGDIVNSKGEVLGKHEGYPAFTIGQRKGLGISHKEPLYVVDINAKKNEVIVGNREALSIKRIYLKDLNLLSDVKKYNDNLFIKVRSTGKLIKAKVNLDKNTAEVNLEENETGISPGQACVFYSKNKFGDKVLGGGWIMKTVNKYLST